LEEGKEMNKEELTKHLENVWRMKNGQPNVKMVEHCLTSTKYTQIGDKFVNVCSLKPSITKTLWYDDEREDCGTSFETFCWYNRHNMPRTFELKHYYDKLYFIPNYYGYDNINLCSLTYLDDFDKKFENKQEVTESELILINQAIEEAKADYEKRLTNYFKRYGDKIRSAGYWVNR